jgi:hypothetical protein
MKEIDFLPDWYKQGRVQQKKHREFYSALGLIVFTMAVWSIFANGRVVAARAKNTNLQKAKIMQVRSEGDYSAAEKEYERLTEKAAVLKSLESKICVSDIIAELTHLLGERIVLKRLEIRAEPLEYPNAQTGVKTVSEAGRAPFEENKKFKIIIAGFASDAAEVAGILSRLEQSGYFFQIVPGFSRNVKNGEYQASEFEISCYLANYRLN